MTDMSPALHWFRADLRLDDNEGLSRAIASGRPLACLYVLDEGADWAPGGASRWWLHHALASLAADLGKLGLPLILRRGDAAEQVQQVASQLGAGLITWTRMYEPQTVERDKALKSDLKKQGFEVVSERGSVLFEPFEIKTQQGKPYGVFTPYWKAVQAAISSGRLDQPLPAPEQAEAAQIKHIVASDDLHSWQLLPTKPDWAAGLRDEWTPGEQGADTRLRDFLDDALKGYGEKRNRPDLRHTSRLSPHLHFGEISPRRIWHVVQHHLAQKPENSSDGLKFLSELCWREFSVQLLFHNPDLPFEPLQRKFNAYPWASDIDAPLQRWQQGLTGYPMVDAGMRELWATGWMHNRVRMIVGSFLVKHLRIHWRHGEDWFWDTLVDADLANNAASWQWIAGCGADAAPYFRIFNPITQGSKFDPKGDYVRRWCPELARLSDKYLFFPADAPSDVLQDAGITLGRDYPHPIVQHKPAREKALAGYQQVKQAAET